jgi:hypothetical protein
MANKTALQQFIEWGDEMLKSNPHKVLSFAEAIDKAEELLEVEKEHLEDCWIAAHQAGRFEGKGIAEEDWQTFFNYYNETYNK